MFPLRPVGLVVLWIAACATPAPKAPDPQAPSAASSTRGTTDVAPRPPVARKEPHATAVHGRELIDDYFWLREKGSPEVVRHLEAENAYAAAMTKRLDPLSGKLYDEMLARIKQDDNTPPVKDGAWRYY